MFFNKKQIDSDNKIVLIKNKIVELKKSIKDLENQLDSIVNESFYDLDEDIINNNILLINSLIYFYTEQLVFLDKKIDEYILIFSKKNKKEKKELMVIWNQQVDIFLLNINTSSDFYEDIRNYKEFDFNDDKKKKFMKIS